MGCSVIKIIMCTQFKNLCPLNLVICIILYIVDLLYKKLYSLVNKKYAVGPICNVVLTVDTLQTVRDIAAKLK